MKQSDTKTIISALQALAHDIVTDDGVVNACLIEAAERLQSLSAEVERLSAQNVLLLGQRERTMQAAKWLSAFKEYAPQYKAAISELAALEKEVLV